jgi:hypothetical protein
MSPETRLLHNHFILALLTRCQTLADQEDKGSVTPLVMSTQTHREREREHKPKTEEKRKKQRVRDRGVFEVQIIFNF